MSEIKNTKGMNFEELKGYYKNNPTLTSRFEKAEKCMRSRGMSEEQIKRRVLIW